MLFVPFVAHPLLRIEYDTGMSQVRRKLFKYYDLVMAAFVTILLCSNIIGAAKVCTVWGIHIRRRRPFLSDQLYLWGHPDRGLWLRPRP